MKRMILIFTASMLLLATFGEAQASYGHYYSNSFKNAALRLDQSGKGFTQQVKYRYGHYSQEYRLARDFSEGAAHYCDLVARGRDLHRLREVFDEVQRRFYRLQQFAYNYHGHSYRHDQLGFPRLSAAFEQARQELRYELAGGYRDGYGKHGSYRHYGQSYPGNHYGYRNGYDGGYSNGYYNGYYKGYGKSGQSYRSDKDRYSHQRPR